MSFSEHYLVTRSEIIEKLKTMPVTEFNYYIALLLICIENESQINPDNNRIYDDLLEKASALVDSLANVYDNPEDLQALDDFQKQVTAIINACITNHFSHQIKRIVLTICSFIMSVLTAAVGAVIGLTSGFLSDYTLIGNFRGAGLGFLTGSVLGVYVGWRIPEVSFKSAFERKLIIFTTSINKLSLELAIKVQEGLDPEKVKQDTVPEKAQKIESGSEPTEKINIKQELELIEETIKNTIIETYFKDKPISERDKAYNDFLESNTQIQICSTKASFLDIAKSLKGHIGHHALIRYKINGQNCKKPIEFGNHETARSPNFVDQSEELRTVTGKKLVEMLVFDAVLRQTHNGGMRYMLTRYDLGANDCLTYVQKVLIGTGQAPTKMRRFNPEVDTVQGTHCVSRIVGFFGKLKFDEHDAYIKIAHQHGVSELKINSHTWEDRKPDAMQRAAAEKLKSPYEQKDVYDVWSKLGKKEQIERISNEWKRWWSDNDFETGKTPTISSP